MVTASEPRYATLKVRFQDSICFLQLHRPEANNTINGQLIEECADVIDRCERSVTLLVLEGLPDVFCFGADFGEVRAAANASGGPAQYQPSPEPLYDLWLRLTTAPFFVIAHVRGKTNAGGMGFVGASDIVIADDTAVFSLSELLFGLLPACVLPFLIRRIGFQKAHYLTAMTQTIDVTQALQWGLVDASDTNSEALLRKHLLRLRRLTKTTIARYKGLANDLKGSVVADRGAAIAANKAVFSDPENIANITRYVETGVFPWERS